MSEYVKVATRNNLKTAGGKLSCEIDERYIVLVELDGVIYCIDDVCTHDGGPLGDGALENGCLVCPRHGAKFDVKTGAAVCMPATEPTNVYRVKVDGDDILVEFDL